MNLIDFAKGFATSAQSAGAKLESAQSAITSIPTQITEKLESVQTSVEEATAKAGEAAQEIKTAATQYAVATLTLQAIAALATAAIAIKLWKGK